MSQKVPSLPTPKENTFFCNKQQITILDIKVDVVCANSVKVKGKENKKEYERERDRERKEKEEWNKKEKEGGGEKKGGREKGRKKEDTNFNSLQ